MSTDPTMRDAVRRIASLLGLTKAGGDPAAQDAKDLLAYLQGEMDRLPKFRNGPWRDVLLTSAAPYTARDGDRIALQDFAPVITLPTTFTRCDSESSIQNDLSRIHVVGDGFYIWSSSKGGWTKADNLDLADAFPFGAEDMPGLVAMTAIAASGEYGDGAIPPATAVVAKQALASLRSRLYRAPSWHRGFTDYAACA